MSGHGAAGLAAASGEKDRDVASPGDRGRCRAPVSAASSAIGLPAGTPRAWSAQHADCAARTVEAPATSRRLAGPGGAELDLLVVGRAEDQPLHVDRRQMDAVRDRGCRPARSPRPRRRRSCARGRHRLVEVARGLAEDEVAALVGLPALDDGEVGADAALEDIVLAVETPSPPCPRRRWCRRRSWCRSPECPRRPRGSARRASPAGRIRPRARRPDIAARTPCSRRHRRRSSSRPGGCAAACRAPHCRCRHCWRRW